MLGPRAKPIDNAHHLGLYCGADRDLDNPSGYGDALTIVGAVRNGQSFSYGCTDTDTKACAIAGTATDVGDGLRQDRRLA